MIRLDFQEMTMNELIELAQDCRKQMAFRGTITTFRIIHAKTKKILKDL